MLQDGITCEFCGRGFYWDPSKGNCASLCPRGHQCVAGIVPETANITYCQDCLICDKGTAQPLSGQYACPECVPGTYEDYEGATACKNCPAGKFQMVRLFLCLCVCACVCIFTSLTPHCPHVKVSGMPYCNTCPQEFFCPNATSKIACPKDRYCPEGSAQPIKCNALYAAEPTVSLAHTHTHTRVSCFMHT
jgi:hypothetical protein